MSSHARFNVVTFFWQILSQVPINADIIFSIVDKDGVKTRAKRCEYTFEKNLPSDNRGFAKFVSHSELRHPQLNLLPADTLTILCEISITGDNVVTSGTSKPAHGRLGRATEPVSRLSLDISSIFEHSKFSDCVVACEGREFRCHKNILAGRSTVFDAMFTHDMEENRKSKVDIVDLDGDTVHDMILYIYSGKVGSPLTPHPSPPTRHPPEALTPSPPRWPRWRRKPRGSCRRPRSTT